MGCFESAEYTSWMACQTPRARSCMPDRLHSVSNAVYSCGRGLWLALNAATTRNTSDNCSVPRGAAAAQAARKATTMALLGSTLLCAMSPYTC